MSIKKELSKMSACQAHALSQDQAEDLASAIKIARDIVSKEDWMGLSSGKIADASKEVQSQYPDVDWKLAVNEGINQFLKG